MGLVVLVKSFSSSDEAGQAEKPKTFYDMAREDDKQFRPEPERRQPRIRTPRSEAPVQQTRKLTEEQRVQAMKLLEMALFERKKARLPGMTTASYKRMVDYCRQIIKEYPGSAEAEKARKMLAEVPLHRRERYNITDAERKN